MESEFIAWLREQLLQDPKLCIEAEASGREPTGLGDDAAILSFAAGRELVVTSDLLTEGVDFLLNEVEPHRIGRKALAVNLSDIAAMAARPVAVIISVALPRTCAAELARELYQGIFELARQYDVRIAGGDTNTWSGNLVVSITAMGQVTRNGPLPRSGARPGDQVLVTGSFGGSILGHHFDFEPRVEEAMLLHDRYRLHAGIDVSDGLLLDLSRMAAESRCGATLSLDDVPIDPAAHELATVRNDGTTALEHALQDGEDFELILAVPAEDAARILAEQPLRVPVTRLGEFIDEPGLWQTEPTEKRRPLKPRGFEH